MSWTRRKWLLLASIFGGILVWDQWSKQFVLDHFHWGESKEIIPGLFNLTYVRNKGAAFGFMHSAPESIREPFFVIVPVLAICILTFLFWRLKEGEKLSAIALSLILSGAIGNLIDRVRFGYVVDFLDFYLPSWGHWPAFNVADSCIVVGVAILFLLSFTKKESAL